MNMAQTGHVHHHMCSVPLLFSVSIEIPSRRLGKGVRVEWKGVELCEMVNMSRRDNVAWGTVNTYE